MIGRFDDLPKLARLYAARRGAVDDCQKFASRLVWGYPVTRALPEISRGRKKNDNATARGGRFPARACRWRLSGKNGPRAVPLAAPVRKTRANPCDKVQNF